MNTLEATLIAQTSLNLLRAFVHMIHKHLINTGKKASEQTLQSRVYLPPPKVEEYRIGFVRLSVSPSLRLSVSLSVRLYQFLYLRIYIRYQHETS